MEGTYTKHQLVEQPAIGLFGDPLRQAVFPRGEVVSFDGTVAANLCRTRDLLLSRLLSGQINVESLDHA